MVEIKLETGKNITGLGKMLLWIIVGILVGSAVLMAVALYYFMVVNPLGT